jgi:hypothetical protein
MKLLVLTDRAGRILSIVRTQVLPAKGKMASKEEIEAAKKMEVGMRAFDDKRQVVNTIEVSQEFAQMSLRELQRVARVDLSGKRPRIMRKP